MTKEVPAAEEIKNIFDRIAPVYDRLNQQLSLGQHHIWKLMAVKWSEPQPGDSALDICCGSGDLTRLLGKKVGPGGSVTGLDFSPRQLAVAARRFTPYDNIRWLEGDALNLPFPDNSFDCITMGYGLRNVTDIPRSLGEIHRVLKSQKRAAILDFHHPTGIIKSFQQWYLDTIVVPAAQKMGLTDEYAYISPSLDRFPGGGEQVKLSYEAGFARATHYPIAGGMMGVLVLEKA
ncbi:MAG: Demethylmenaquinone methyltransferase [Chroococcopsis gigantea SAG 12.99]|jgi:ubiquinone/menaquinone biosynthesis methyltransferase|nr:Demethylmenaquinone methyltransferase [Chroococcopsis gigantea SAG 12.99]